ncbi:reverse transcriptase domain-containing protein [Tanacetum coccineum]
MVKALLLDKKNQSQTPAPVKAVEESYVTCGGAHSYRNCPATDGNVYRDNIQEYVSQTAAANFNQGNTDYRAPIANQIRPSGFPPVQQNQGNNQNRGNNYNHGQIYRPPINQPPVPQAPPYQAPASQTQGVSKDDFQNYVKANDTVMRNMQNQNQNLQNQMTNLTDMPSKFVNSNTASTSGSGTLSSNTIINPKVDLKGITTRSGVAYQGPTIPTSSSPPKAVERETEVTKDTVPPTNNESTKDVQPLVVQLQPHVPNFETVVAPLSFSELTPTCMTLELVDRSITQLIGIAEDVDVKVGKLQFPADFVVVDFDADPRVPLILGRSILKTGRALIDVYEVNRIHVIEMACEEYSQEVLGFYDVITMDFLLEEVDAFLALEDDPTSPEVDDSYYDPEGDILLLESFLNDDPSYHPPLPLKKLFAQNSKEHKVCDDKLPVILAKDLSVEEKSALIKVLKSHKRAIA